MNVLMWYRQNLRTSDHAALCFAAELGGVVPIYIVDPADWSRADASGRQFAFLAECLEDLRVQLHRLGAPLLIRVGPAIEVLQRLCRKHAITEIVSEGAIPVALADWAAASGIRWHDIRQPNCGAALPEPMLRAPIDLTSPPVPPPQMLRLKVDRCAHRQSGGRNHAIELLDTFLTARGLSYHRAQSNPLTAERASSRLSGHLTFGTLSLREVKAALATRLDEHPKGRWSNALHAFQTQIARREALPMGMETPVQGASDPRLGAWINGETGLPFLDALMRYLATTGWLNQHLRTLVLSLGCHQLGLDWKSACTALARQFTDYDPAIFWLHATEIAGQTDRPPRLFHLTKQALDLDPTGIFTRRWLPELALLPDSTLQTPWKWAGAARLLGHRYPEPVIDLVTAHHTARDAIWARHGRPMRAVAAAPLLIETHHQPAKGQLRLEF